jgi:hypothetical protein
MPNAAEATAARMRKPCDSTGRERQPDPLFVPHVTSEIDREKRPNARLDIGEE